MMRSACRDLVRERAGAAFALRLTTGFALLCALALAAAIPAAAEVVEKRVAASADDAEELPGVAPSVTSSDIELVQDGGDQTVGLRWTGLAIPPGATITAAWVQFDAKEAKSTAASLRIYGQASDQAAAFTTAIGNVSSRPRTTAFQSWSPAAWVIGAVGPAQRTPDLSGVIQEIVNRPGWASGQPLALIVSGTGRRTAWAYNGLPAGAPLLHVEFITVAPPELPPVARLAAAQTLPLTVLADASASTDTDLHPIATYAFDFGDGSPIVTTTHPSATATHAYAGAGTYTVSVIATDTGGSASAPATASIAVNANVTGAVERRVAASSDDAEEPPTGSVGLSSSDLELVLDGVLQKVGLRWTNVTIPAGATITAAWIQFAAKEAHSVATSLEIRALAEDAAATFASTAGSLSARPRTSAMVAWAPPAWVVGAIGPGQRTTDLRAVIQEVVDRPGWASGNPLAIVIAGSGRRGAWAFNGKPADAPLLHVEYSVGPPPPQSPPVARLAVVQATTPPLTVIADASGSTDDDRLSPIASYRFDFLDGSPPAVVLAPATTATHAYSDVGTHQVELVATDTQGNASAPVRTTVVVTPPPDFAPVAHLSVAPIASPPLTVTADASASTDDDGVTPIVSYEFDFGDGTPLVTTAAPVATATHTYGAPGTHTVTLVAIDSGSKPSAPDTATVNVVSGFPGSLEKRIAASGDDAEEPPSGSVGISSSDLELVMDSERQTVGMRWTDLAIPPGAVITRAWVQFAAKESHAEPTHLELRGEATHHASPFASPAGNISLRARTNALVAWDPPVWSEDDAGASQRTPDLAAVIQEIVARPGWARGNAIALVVTGSGHRTAFAFDGNPAAAPLLHVDYLSLEPPVDEAPIARLVVVPAPLPAFTIHADASASTDTDLTPIATYRFEFGDGTPPLVTASATTAHTYAGAGTYTVRLIVTDTGGKTSEPATSTITVNSGSPSQVAVYVGYYDTHHPGRTQPKPNPWKSSANVVFVGKPDPGTSNEWDSSCLRVDNLTASDLTGVGVVAYIGSKKYALWGPQTIPAGKTLILAQTSFENFDGSDTSPAGCYGCSPSLCLSAVVSTKPTVQVTIGGTTTTYLDATQVLNTRGVDGAGCPATGTRNDESTQWKRIDPIAVSSSQAARSGETFERSNLAPRVLALAPLTPNPTHGEIEIDFTLPRRGPVKLGVYDVMGRQVKSYIDEVLEAGDFRGHLDLAGAASGMYFCRLWTPEREVHRSFVLVK